MAAEIPISKVITVPPQSLPEALAVADDAFALVFSGLGPLQKLAVKKLLAKLIAADLVKSTRADLLADLAFVADKVALVHNDPVAAQNGWYRKTGGSGAGTWTQFEQLTLALRAEILAARDTAAAAAGAAIAAAGTAQGLSNFRATFAEAIADFAVGDYFTCTESGAIRMYQRTAGLPGYTDQGDVAAPTFTADNLRSARVENKAGLRNLLVELGQQAAAPRLMAVVTDGDSVSPRVGEHVAIGLRSKYGDGGVVSPLQEATANYGSDTVRSATTGAITDGAVGDATYPYLPNNRHMILATGATVTFRARNTGHATISRIMAWLVKRPGDGSALLEVKKISDGTVMASWNTGSLAGIDGTLVKANAGAHFTGLDSTIPYELKITATGTVCILTALFARDSGVILYQAGLGGSPISKQLPALQGAAWRGIMADINCRLMIHEDKTEDAGATYDAHIAAWQAMPNVACLYIGSLPDSSAAGPQTVLIDSLRAKVLAAGFAFIDGYAVMKDYAEVTRLGQNNDGVHLLTPAYWAVANVILSELYLDDPRLPLLMESRIRSLNYSVTRNDGFGPASREIRFAAPTPGVGRVDMWNIGGIGLKGNQTEATDSLATQVRMASYSNFGVHFLSAAGGAAYLVNVAALHLGTAGGAGASSGTIIPDYNSWRLNFVLTNGAGDTTKDAILGCGGLRVGGVNMLTAQSTGWTGATGIANKAAFIAYGGAVMSAVYVQAEAQATNDAAKNNAQRIKAIEDALRALGVIN